MRVTLVAVTTANGFIADQNGRYPWASQEDRLEFGKLYRQTGCIIIGRKTYDSLKNRPDFPTPGRTCVVVTRNPDLTPKTSGIHFSPSPVKALQLLKDQKFDHILLGGGGELNSSFMKSGLVDDIILTVEPVLISRGTLLFNVSDLYKQLELKAVAPLNKNTLRIHYSVMKNKYEASYA